jgi:ubiquinone/menaquinone biosynthesis C-methylase UbiE
MSDQLLLDETNHDSCENGCANRVTQYAVQLRCPRCGADVDELTCTRCAFAMRLHNGIVHALPPERAAYYARFIADYESIRAAEGRGSGSRDFYLSLPYADTTGRNSHQWTIRSRSYEHLIRQVLTALRSGASILDLGSGNCWMSYRLALQGYSPVAVDLLTNEDDGLGAAGHYEAHLGAPIPRFQAEATCLPFRDAQFDAIIFNASFHYSEDYEATLHEALRCLKTSGIVIVSDTPWYSSENSGCQMVAERQAQFCKRFGTASDSVRSLEYLTNARLKALETALSIRWTPHTPWYGWKWAMRPLLAIMRKRREPSRFRIYVAQKSA